MNNQPLTNTYAKEYYDAQIAPLSSYEQGRWHSSPIREFEYGQMKRTLEKALQGRTYRNAIEIGPGDAVWTGLLRQYVTGNIHLVEQSEEMLKRAKDKAAALGGVTFEHSDFLASRPPSAAELVTAIRCFEYFEDKLGALKKMRALLTSQGKLVIITKNPKLMTHTSVQHRTIHSGQLSRQEMQRLAREAGLTIVESYPAVLRWKASWGVMRVVFDLFHRVVVGTRGHLIVPFVNTYAAESYVYVMRSII